MRKSTVMMMAILLMCFGTLLVAAGVISKPMKQDAAMAKELTKLLAYQEVIREGSRVTVVRRPATKDKTLAQQGRGAVVGLSPSRRVLDRRGAVRTLLSRIAGRLKEGLAGLDWIEFRIEFAQDAEVFRTLVMRTNDGGFTSPHPAV